MNRFTLFLVVGVCLSLVFPAHGKEKTGILVDAKCGATVSMERAKTESHPISCALHSKKSGFGIVVEGKFLGSGDFGNEQALLLFKANQKQSNLKVRVGEVISKKIWSRSVRSKPSSDFDLGAVRV